MCLKMTTLRSSLPNARVTFLLSSSSTSTENLSYDQSLIIKPTFICTIFAAAFLLKTKGKLFPEIGNRFLPPASA